MSDLASLDARARLIFRQIVESYLETGAPVGSRVLSEVLEQQLSPASIRATMAQLERSGLLYAPHVSAGRLPTQSGLRLFIDGLLQVSELTAEERGIIAPGTQTDLGAEQLLKQAVDSLSGLSQCAGLVLSPGTDPIIKHIEFTPISDDQILVILVDEANQVENRVIPKPRDLLPSTLTEVSNYLNARLRGRTLEELRREAQSELEHLRTELGELTAQIVAAGLASWAGRDDDERASQETLAKSLIVRGEAHLLNNIGAMEDLERVRLLFEDLERKEELINLLSEAEDSEGVRIFIGSETPLFSLSGSSLIISSYRNSDAHIVGVLGVIAPTRSNYARLIPMVDHTAQVVTKLLS